MPTRSYSHRELRARLVAAHFSTTPERVASTKTGPRFVVRRDFPCASLVKTRTKKFLNTEISAHSI